MPRVVCAQDAGSEEHLGRHARQYLADRFVMRVASLDPRRQRVHVAEAALKVAAGEGGIHGGRFVDVVGDLGGAVAGVCRHIAAMRCCAARECSQPTTVIRALGGNGDRDLRSGRSVSIRDGLHVATSGPGRSQPGRPDSTNNGSSRQ